VLHAPRPFSLAASFKFFRHLLPSTALTMQLINVYTTKLEEFFGKNIPPYAALSHTWGSEELSYQEWLEPSQSRHKAGYLKIEQACIIARKDGIGYLWCDTVCIDKRSSAELCEAINSMFAWYKGCKVCYAYLSDTSANDRKSFLSSRWMRRGWTLQELLAPTTVAFFDRDWQYINSSHALRNDISKATGIPAEYFAAEAGGARRPLSSATAAMRMSWVSCRETTRVEDMAYCMLGIFDINLTTIYGEGTKAFMRLQDEIIKTRRDHTLFCWAWMPQHVPADWVGMLAPSPRVFEHSGKYEAIGNEKTLSQAFSIANGELNISLQSRLVSSDKPNGRAVVWLDVSIPNSKLPVALPVYHLRGFKRDSRAHFEDEDRGQAIRAPYPPIPFPLYPLWVRPVHYAMLNSSANVRSLMGYQVDQTLVPARCRGRPAVLLMENIVSMWCNPILDGYVMPQQYDRDRGILRLKPTQDGRYFGVMGFRLHGSPPNTSRTEWRTFLVFTAENTVSNQMKFLFTAIPQSDDVYGPNYMVDEENLRRYVERLVPSIRLTARGTTSASGEMAYKLRNRGAWRQCIEMELDQRAQFTDSDGGVVQIAVMHSNTLGPKADPWRLLKPSTRPKFLKSLP
jgi:hypothetical protein